jgi:hypothetical protein
LLWYFCSKFAFDNPIDYHPFLHTFLKIESKKVEPEENPQEKSKGKPANEHQHHNDRFVESDKLEEKEEEDVAASKKEKNPKFFSKYGIHIKNITITFIFRSCLIGYSIWITAFVACMQQKTLFWLLIIPIFLIILDMLYVCIMRKGIEFDW